MDKLGIFLAFDGNCADVLEFYGKVFDTKPGRMMKYSDAPEGSKMPGLDEKIMYADMIIGGENVMFSDVPPGGSHVAGSNFCLNYSAVDSDKVHRIFNALADGGTVKMPPQKTFFSELYSMVVDKFGITWNVML